jgi:hypothetical protein
MKRGLTEHKEAQAAVLAGMAATRAELVSASQLSKIAAGANRTARHISPDAGPVFLRGPIAALLAIVLVGSVIIGPRRIVVTSFRAVLTAWITRTVRALADG